MSLTKGWMLAVGIEVQAVVKLTIGIFPQLVGESVSIEVNQGRLALVGTLAVGVGRTSVDGCRTPASSHHDTATHGGALGRACAQE